MKPQDVAEESRLISRISCYTALNSFCVMMGDGEKKIVLK